MSLKRDDLLLSPPKAKMEIVGQIILGWDKMTQSYVT